MSHYAYRLGLRSVVQHARRNLATGCAIAFGYAALLMTFGYSNRVNDFFSVSTIFLQHSGHVMVFKKDGLRKRLVRPARFSLTAADQEGIAQYLSTQKSVDFSARYLTGAGLVGNGCTSFLFSALALEPSIESRVRTHPSAQAFTGEMSGLVKGKNLWDDPRVDQVSVTEGLARRLGKPSLNGASTKASGTSALPDCKGPGIKKIIDSDSGVQLLARDYDKRISAADADISSYYSTGTAVGDNRGMIMPLALMQQLFNTDSVSYISIFLKDGASPKEFLETFVEAMKGKGIEVDAYVWNDVRINPGYVNGVAFLDFSILLVMLVVLVVVLLSIVNTLTIGLAESRREIGTMRALGFTPLQIGSVYAVEVGLVSLGSFALGALVTRVCVEAIKKQNIPFRLPGLPYETTFQLTPNEGTYWGCAALILFLVSFTTLAMTRRYARQPMLNLLDPGA